MTRVLIFGANGQDGRILLERCSKVGATLGLDIGSVTGHWPGDNVLPDPIDLQNAERVSGIVERFVPDEIYYLAAHHHSSEEKADEVNELRRCNEVHVIGLIHVLEAVRKHTPRCRLFYAGSSQMFGQPRQTPQNETTPFAPRNPYAITKVAGAHLCALYREVHAVHASVGILYNHESPLRGPRFVTQRIVRGAWAGRRDPTFKLRLGSLSAVVDWGYAPDYVDAMKRIVSQPVPDDYVVATGVPHSVQDFVEIAFGELGLDWHAHVEEDPTLVRTTTATLVGDATKLRDRTAWKPTVGFENMVRILVRAAGP